MRFTCRITAGRWVFAWRWRIPSASRHSSCRMPSRTTRVSALIGTRAALFGPIERPMKARCAQICFRWRPRARHVGNDANVERHDPDLYTDEFYFLNQPGQGDIQSDLFYDYRTNRSEE